MKFQLAYFISFHDNPCGVHNARFLKYVWPFYNIMHERVKLYENFIKFEKEPHNVKTGAGFLNDTSCCEMTDSLLEQ